MTRAMAGLAFATLAAFLGILAWEVPHPDLVIIVAVVLILAAYDFLSGAREDR
ncbi:hypothetical protein [Mangrovicoccus algicola]|uniref:Uncharacterized protein n=1 Tax=Mangrovicoccus algicola TaxID=2771008 RepID=A0A8J6YUF8_9RHOB|nr:hypothetical protein [Mangrovicoccus algicola]MBE3637930.1 hypothetical protein [Mangrovicoccus algicola]